MPSWRKRLGPLEEREFLLLFLGRTVSIFGSALAPIALAFAVLEIGGSATDLGLVVAAGTAPMVMFVLVGGIWADRVPRHYIMVASDTVSGAARVVAAVMILTCAAEVWHLGRTPARPRHGDRVVPSSPRRQQASSAAASSRCAIDRRAHC